MSKVVVASSAIIISVLVLAGIMNAVINYTGPNYPVPDLDDNSSSGSYRGGKTRRSKRI